MSVAAELHVDTPEGLRLRLRLAGLGERLGALLIDLSLILVGYFLFAVMLGFGLDLTGGSRLPLLLLGFGLRHGYFLFFELRWQGATPGKRALGLKVVPRDGGSLDGRAVLARNLLRDAELFLPIYVMLAPEALVGESPKWLYVVAFAWVGVFSGLPLLNAARARAGDLVAGTVVIRLPRARLEVDEAEIARKSPHVFGAEQLSIYGAKELDTLAYLLRELDPDGGPDRDLFVALARTIAWRVGYVGPPVEQDAEGFLRAFYGAQRAYLERQLLFGRRKADKNAAVESV